MAIGNVTLMAVNDDWDEFDVVKEVGEFDWAEDGVSEQALDLKKVHEARKEEMDVVKNISVYDERPIEECWEKTGVAPITTK